MPKGGPGWPTGRIEGRRRSEGTTMTTRVSLPSTPRLRLGIATLALAFAMHPVIAQDLSTSLLRIEQMQAQGGDVESQFALGARYEDGNGVEKNLSEAIRWYTEAANGGHTGAQFKLGQFHEQGIGVTRNPQRARGWFELAATNGHHGAREHLAAQERARVAEEARAAQRAVATTAPRPAPRPATPPPAPRREEPARPATPPPPAAPRMPDIRDVVMNSQWHTVGTPALFLPSPATSCLVSGEEVVCFSREQTRGIEQQDVTYTAKATLSDFDPEGRFRINYIYNVVDLKRRDEPATAPTPAGLRPERGWLEPGRSLRCEAASRTELRCNGDTE
ncbi:MAG TPA: sel1 repeat family protein, partial [Thioalkalivibrio sp.]|nr:sel1 repeat family protein [Thioalkalivibrio sp.]